MLNARPKSAVTSQGRSAKVATQRLKLKSTLTSNDYTDQAKKYQSAASYSLNTAATVQTSSPTLNINSKLKTFHTATDSNIPTTTPHSRRVTAIAEINLAQLADDDDVVLQVRHRRRRGPRPKSQIKPITDVCWLPLRYENNQLKFQAGTP